MAAASLDMQLFRRHFDDGLLDFCAGLGALGIGLGWMSTAPVYGAMAGPLAFTLWQIMRKALIAPRLGEAEFAPDPAQRARRGMTGLVLLFSLSALLGLGAFLWVGGFLGEFPELPGRIVLAVPGLIIASAALLVGLVLGFTRFLIYALLFAGSALILQLGLEQGPGWDMALAALAPTLWGGARLLAFLRSHPVQ